MPIYGSVQFFMEVVTLSLCLAVLYLFLDIAPYKKQKLSVHFENHSPFLTTWRLERWIEVSHWGNIAVEEKMHIQHTGAKLKGSFSRCVVVCLFVCLFVCLLFICL